MTSGAGHAGIEGPHVQIRMGTRRWHLSPGTEVTFGRGPDQDIRLGHDPVDDYVSRRAGTLVVLDDGVLVRNGSTTQMVQLVALPGPEQRIAPGAAMATMPHELSRVVVPGRFNSRYTISIDTRGLRPGSAVPAAVAIPLQSARGVVTRSGAGKVTPRERRMLAALCEPLLTLAGDAAVPSTYKQIAARIGVPATSVRACLDYLRARLSDVDGIPGLRANEDAEPRDGASYLTALAQWAVESREVTRETLDMLNPAVGSNP